MIYYVELWNAKPAWKALSTKERADYMGQVGAAIQGLLDRGVKILTWSTNNEETTKSASYDYFAVWAFPDQKIAHEFEKTVEGAGWYNYFEQENVMGEGDSADNIIRKLVQL